MARPSLLLLSACNRLFFAVCRIDSCYAYSMVFSMVDGVFQALTVNALNGDDRERWMRAIADKVRSRDLCRLPALLLAACSRL